MDTYIGVLSVTSAPVAAAIDGMNALVTVGNVRRDGDKYKKAVEVILYNGEFVKSNQENSMK
ncbi:hypothetical protein [Leptolyngbya sp. 7M]|uniref:hypothetical protein n=1 Tax=Leptolyngbya sp. 7M TaxID=2812896 RepID=UPI001B8AA6DD|nr:hypothetical protein [Leptolyngbya sp. 7M]QYO65530.1 hypothetical protein JVX88_01715 [Leptolyngbya sp. 7M]